MAYRTRIAAQLADQKLTEVIVTEAWRDEQTEGDFGIDYPEFRWVLFQETWAEDTMRLIYVVVYFEVQGQEQFVRLSTLAEEAET